MKTLRILPLLLIALTLNIGCDKSLELDEKFSPVTPADVDADAGDWDMIVLASPDAIAVPAPDAIGSTPYLAELAAIKAEQATLTAEQKKIIKYWSAGGVVRWNQFLRELVARYNLPPAPNSQDVYPLPDAEYPFGDPNLPFANPPYAARGFI